MYSKQLTTVLLILLFPWSVGNTMESSVPPADKPIVIIGASYAASWPIDTIAGHRVVNKGIDGNQSFEMAARFDLDVLAEKPAQVLIWGFVNDIFRSDQDKLDAAKQRVVDGYLGMIAAAKANNIDVIIATEVTIREQSGFVNWISGVVGRALGKTSYQETINRHVSEVNDQLEEIARSQEVLVIDFENLLAGADGQRQRKFAADDGSHLSTQAYDTLSEFTMKTLSADSSAQEVE